MKTWQKNIIRTFLGIMLMVLILGFPTALSLWLDSMLMVCILGFPTTLSLWEVVSWFLVTMLLIVYGFYMGALFAFVVDTIIRKIKKESSVN